MGKAVVGVREDSYNVTLEGGVANVAVPATGAVIVYTQV